MSDTKSYSQNLETLLERALTAGEEIQAQRDSLKVEVERLTTLVAEKVKEIEELRAENERLKDAAEGMALLFIKS